MDINATARARVRTLVPMCLLEATAASIASAQERANHTIPAILGPAAPGDSEVMSKAAQGRITLRAHRLTEPPTVDGSLDEAIYRQIKPIDDWVQREPVEGATPSTSPRVAVEHRVRRPERSSASMLVPP